MSRAAGAGIHRDGIDEAALRAAKDLAAAGPRAGYMNALTIFNVLSCGAKGDGVTDDSGAIQIAINACSAAGGGVVFFPRLKFLCAHELTVPQDVALIGTPPNRTHNGGSPLLTLMASTLLITCNSLTVPPNVDTPFLLLGTPAGANNITVQGLCFAYPTQQASTAAAPTVFPPTISYGWGGSGGITLRDLFFYNSYDAIDFGEANGSALNILISDCNIGAYHDGIKIDYCEGSCTIENTGWGPFWDNGGNPTTIDTWVQNNGTAFKFYRVDGLHANNISGFRGGVGIALMDSPSTSLTTLCGYGVIQNFSLDTFRYPILCSATNSLGYKISNGELTANAMAGGASANYLIQSGGSMPPVLMVQNVESRANGVPHVIQQAGVVSFTGCTFNDDWSSANGCFQPTGAVDLSVIGCNFGAVHGTGIFKWADGLTKLVFVGNKVGTHALPQNAWAVNTNPIIRDNRGLNPIGAMAAPPFSSNTPYVNNTGFDQIITIAGGTVTNISLNSQATGLTSGSFYVPAGTSLTIQFSVAPTITASGN